MWGMPRQHVVHECMYGKQKIRFSKPSDVRLKPTPLTLSSMVLTPLPVHNEQKPRGELTTNCTLAKKSGTTKRSRNCTEFLDTRSRTGWEKIRLSTQVKTHEVLSAILSSPRERFSTTNRIGNYQSVVLLKLSVGIPVSDTHAWIDRYSRNSGDVQIELCWISKLWWAY